MSNLSLPGAGWSRPSGIESYADSPEVGARTRSSRSPRLVLLRGELNPSRHLGGSGLRLPSPLDLRSGWGWRQEVPPSLIYMAAMLWRVRFGHFGHVEWGHSGTNTTPPTPLAPLAAP